jgi:hypothetical protein
MRVSSRFLILFFVLVLGLCGAQSARAAYFNYGGAWVSTDGDTNVLSFKTTVCTEDQHLYLYHWNEGGVKNISSDLLVMDLISGPILQAASVTISQTGGTFYATMGSQSIALGSDGWFGLYFYAPLEERYKDLEIEQIDPSLTTMWSIKTPSGCAQVALVDATPVPVPAAAWILGSGLLGIAGLRKRFKR